ncbi:MAG: TRAP transporter small permease subunit [Burkholderiaceae bacterium]|nr:TRAP transporter small permease subunit [Burkholderiaceae bacterium]
MLENATPEGTPPDGPLLKAYGRVVGTICKTAMIIATVLIIIDLVLIGAAVLMRYVFSAPIVWGDEIVSLSLTAIVMLAAPEVLRKNGHIGVDILVDMLKPKAAAWATVWSCVAVLSMSAILILNGWKTVALSKMIGRLTDGHLELPIWMLQLLLPLGGILLAIVAFEIIWRSLVQISSGHYTKEGAI